jgi:hypothetical protein
VSDDTTQPLPRGAVTVDALHRWVPVLVALVVSAFTAGGAAAYLNADIIAVREKVATLEAKGSEPLRVLAARVDGIDVRFATIVADRDKDRALLDRLARGIESMDRRLFALVCKSDPTQCSTYTASIPP